MIAIIASTTDPSPPLIRREKKVCVISEEKVFVGKLLEKSLVLLVLSDNGIEVEGEVVADGVMISKGPTYQVDALLR